MKEGKVVNKLNKDKVKWECTSTYLQFNVDYTKVLMKTLCSEKHMASYHNFFMERPFRLFLTCCLFSWTSCFLSQDFWSLLWELCICHYTQNYMNACTLVLTVFLAHGKMEFELPVSFFVYPQRRKWEFIFYFCFLFS